MYIASTVLSIFDIPTGRRRPRGARVHQGRGGTTRLKHVMIYYIIVYTL